MASTGIGDRVMIEGDEWEVVNIAQPYDEAGNMLEPVVELKMYCNTAWPLYRMTKEQKAARKHISLFEFNRNYKR